MAARGLRPVQVTVPYSIGLFGGLAGAAAVASTRPALEVAAEPLSGEGLAVHVEGLAGAPARAAEEAARLLLERVGEEARLRLVARPLAEPLLLPEAHAAAAAARAVAEALGIEPAPGDAAEALVRATALAAGRPLAPVAAAAYTSASVVAAEQPPAYAPLEPPPARLYAIPACRGLQEPPVAVEASRHLQLVQAAAVLAASAAAGAWGPTRLWRLLGQESPWDYAAPEELRSARRAALREGALAAGVEPYSLALVVAAETPGPARAAAARLEAALACRTTVVEAEPLRRLPRGEEEEEEA